MELGFGERFEVFHLQGELRATLVAFKYCLEVTFNMEKHAHESI